MALLILPTAANSAHVDQFCAKFCTHRIAESDIPPVDCTHRLTTLLVFSCMASTVDLALMPVRDSQELYHHDNTAPLSSLQDLPQFYDVVKIPRFYVSRMWSL